MELTYNPKIPDNAIKQIGVSFIADDKELYANLENVLSLHEVDEYAYRHSLTIEGDIEIDCYSHTETLNCLLVDKDGNFYEPCNCPLPVYRKIDPKTAINKVFNGNPPAEYSWSE